MSSFPRVPQVLRAQYSGFRCGDKEPTTPDSDHHAGGTPGLGLTRECGRAERAAALVPASATPGIGDRWNRTQATNPLQPDSIIQSLPTAWRSAARHFHIYSLGGVAALHVPTLRLGFALLPRPALRPSVQPAPSPVSDGACPAASHPVSPSRSKLSWS